jgi:hypothetical protein
LIVTKTNYLPKVNRSKKGIPICIQPNLRLFVLPPGSGRKKHVLMKPDPPTDVKGLKEILPQLDEFCFTTGERKVYEALSY